MNSLLKRYYLICAAVSAFAVVIAPHGGADEFRSEWPADVTRVWAGPDYHANRLQDWRIHDGRLECVEAQANKPMRAAHLLTAALRETAGDLTMSVRLGPIDVDAEPNPESWAGFLIGAGGEHVDYRLTALVHHRPAEDGGLAAVIDGAGRVAFRDNEKRTSEPQVWGLLGELQPDELKEIPAASHSGDGFGDEPLDEVELRLHVEPVADRYRLTVSAHDPTDGTLISQAILEEVEQSLVDGGLGLVSHLGPMDSHLGYWFRNWRVAGSKVAAHPERAFGPVLCSQYTLSRGRLKMTAQMPPLGEQDTQTAQLQVQTDDSEWRAVARGRLIEDSYTIPFRVENWDATRDTPYRIAYELKTGPDDAETRYWHGTVRKEPLDKPEFVVAAFTGNRNHTGGLKWNHDGIWFPAVELVRAIKYHDPDFLFFSGDQIYEGDLTGAQRGPLDKAILDYLDKWYRWCWAYGDLARDRPCVCIPDDHDVYHGNIWGAGGRAAARIDDGGYIMPPRFVKMVERTQTSHLPDPYDPTPVEQGIGVYYTSVDYGGVSFAVIEDRKFKSSPMVMVPAGDPKNGWFHKPGFDPATQADVPGAVLLGERQLGFLRDWATDWSGGTWMKAALSQTLFSNVATIPEEAATGAVLPGLELPAPGEYPGGFKLAADCDSGGWPQTGRNKALAEFRRCFALHICGDQHLGSTVQYGVDDWDDAGYAFCVPSIGNIWPRRWFPPHPGRNRKADMPLYTGQYLDGFGNHVTVHAVSNPARFGREPAALYNRAPGYGIIRFDRKTRDILIECWPRWADPSKPGSEQYPGWPITIAQDDNYRREAAAYLPTIEVSGLENPVVQVIDESNDEVVYTLRIEGASFRPRVREFGAYSVKVGNPDTGQMKTLTGLRCLSAGESRTIVVEF